MTERILVVGPSWVGDMVMAQSLFKALKTRFPESIIDVLAPEWSLPIISRMPEINEMVSMPVGHGEFNFKTRFKLGRELKQNQYTRSIILPRSFKSALVPFFAGIPIRTGYRGEMRYGLINDMRELDKSILTQTVQRYVALGLENNAVLPPVIEYPKLIVDSKHQQELLINLGLDIDKPTVGFMPGAEYGPAKCWPIEYFGELACMLAKENIQVWVFGSQKEQKQGDEIKQASIENVVNLCGKTELADVVDLLACTKQVVTNDSGLMHVACAVGTKVFGVYGSSSSEYTPPLSSTAVVVKHAIECSPCFERTCKFGHYECLTKITPELLMNVLVD